MIPKKTKALKQARAILMGKGSRQQMPKTPKRDQKEDMRIAGAYQR